MSEPTTTSTDAYAPSAPAARIHRLRRIGVLSLAKFQAIFGAAIGLIIGVFFTLFATMMGAAGGVGAAEFGMMAGVGVFAIVLFPLIYAIFGFLAGALMAWIYNLVAGWAGGVEISVE